MPASNKFGALFATVIVATLGCFDRVIFRGHLPLGHSDAWLDFFVGRELGMLCKDFLALMEAYSNRIVSTAQKMAETEGAEYRFLQGKHSKEQIIDLILATRRHAEGLIAVLCCMETCRTVKIQGGEKRPRMVWAKRPQRVLYFYFLDPALGRLYVRLESWFPFTIQVYVNGHEWLARRMLSRRLGFIQRDNTFAQLDDPEQAQTLSDQFCRLPWVRILNRLARRCNPLLDQHRLCGSGYYWVIDQAEYSTDVLFRDRASLDGLFPRLLDHVLTAFQPRDILTFLGRKLDPRFQGEMLSSVHRERTPGMRIKHRVKNNWLKMYTKFGQVLRVETVINSPREFRVRRKVTRRGRQVMAWAPMNKGVAHFFRYQEVGRSANRRYLDALATVPQPQVQAPEVHKLSTSCQAQGRSYAGFNPGCREDIQLFEALLRGEHLIKGFRNADLRRELYPARTDRLTQKRQAQRIGRQLKRLHVRKLIAKIPRTRRWLLTDRGRRLLTHAVRYANGNLPQAA